ncbi:heavy metal-responsive transcriptional regulator [Pseudanabaena sp. FACHB-1998]|uniref:heavy metal-responsive transcriptional regulator n=1 Tax=Pseudanabaena sp. FACHB-1998 TaxID=2692858 RepID=UPI001681C195|nr:heavy metal-responsive transcriptional regulator [Pseudanabaena sp. FACHB-1998]MBD2175300.1 heavy metal-responsive transcriptional regulator [Pseudanabaena sp. FACHB-1998]
MLLAQGQKLLLIGQISKESGIPIKTIRYYEELGLINSSGRTEGKYRLFKPEEVTRLSFIKTLQKLGLSLQEIAEVLKIYDDGNPPCDEIKQKLETQIAEIDRHVLELMTLRGKISGLLDRWTPPQADHEGEICPILHKNL